MSRFLRIEKWSHYYNHVRQSNYGETVGREKEIKKIKDPASNQYTKLKKIPHRHLLHTVVFQEALMTQESNGAFDGDSRARESQENRELRLSSSSSIGSCFPALERLNLSKGDFCCITNFLKRSCDLRAARLSVTVRRPPR